MKSMNVYQLFLYSFCLVLFINYLFYSNDVYIGFGYDFSVTEFVEVNRISCPSSNPGRDCLNYSLHKCPVFKIGDVQFFFRLKHIMNRWIQRKDQQH